MPMKVLFLPLDSRPCNRLFPGQLLAWCGAECIQPPREIMDHFTRPSDWNAVQAFLTAHAAEADAWAISLDQLCYGSLLASREDQISEEEALGRLAWLEELHNQYPEKPIHAMNTILRTSVSTTSSRDLQVYRAMMDYSYWSDRSDVTGSMEDNARAERAVFQIPEEIILKYHALRQRNHLINARAVEMAKRGALTSLLMLMEDSAEYGFHRAEQRALQAQIGDDPRIMIKNGTDDSALLVMKCLPRQEVAVSVRWLGREDGNFIARYEDRPFSENLEKVLRYLGIRQQADSPVVLAIASQSESTQIDLNFATALPSYPREEALAAGQVNDLLREGKTVYLLDLFCCNGGWAPFTRLIEEPGRLSGYSAWNTASNALDTIVAQLYSDETAGRRNLAFRNERFLDDLLYEGCIRFQLNHTLRAYGQDTYRLSDPESSALLLQKLYRQLFSQQEHWTQRFTNIVELLRAGGEYELSFPWERTFEVEARFLPSGAFPGKREAEAD